MSPGKRCCLCVYGAELIQDDSSEGLGEAKSLGGLTLSSECNQNGSTVHEGGLSQLHTRDCHGPVVNTHSRMTECISEG